MSDSKSVSMPPHLWEALELMSSEMGVPVDSLVSQAVFTLARLNGYVVAGRASEGAGAHAEPGPSALASQVASGGRTSALPARQPSAPPGIKARAQVQPQPEPEPEPELPPEEDDNPFDQQDDQNYDPPQDEELPPEENYDEPEPEPEPAPRARGGAPSLTLIVAGRDPYKLTGDSFNIGRGKSCDFVIDSNRVSREHVRISREGADFVLEDLNSSNGTFFGPNKEKISKRKIKDGDEFTLGTEKIKFQIRK